MIWRAAVASLVPGRIADGVLKNGGWGSVEELAELNGRVDASAERNGRDPGSIRHVINGAAYLGGDEGDVLAFRERAAARGGPVPAGLIGTVDQVIEQVRAYRGAGVDMFNIRFSGPDIPDQMRRFGAEVIPETRSL